jgi:xanthine dehydrogenase accessory factor
VRTVIEEVGRWLGAGQPVVLARVVEVVGSGVQPAGAAIAVTEDAVVGSASGGCVEGALVAEAREALAGDGRPRLRTFGCSDDEAFDVGLTCGGLVRVLIERLDPQVQLGWVHELTEVLQSGTGAALVEVVDGPDELLGAKAIVLDGPSPDASFVWPQASPVFGPDVITDARLDLAAERSAPHTYEVLLRQQPVALTLFVDSFAAPPEMLVVGAASFTAALTAQAKLLGYHVVVCDARAVFASLARFPLADEVVVDWPDRYLERSGASLGPRDAICVLTHDPKFDLPTIMAALATRAGYIGVMGSRRTQEDRRRRLQEAGVTEAELARLRGPIGLDLGANSPEETAVSIAAEIIAMRRGHSGGSLAATSGPIHSGNGRPARPGIPDAPPLTGQLPDLGRVHEHP